MHLKFVERVDLKGCHHTHTHTHADTQMVAMWNDGCVN